MQKHFLVNRHFLALILLLGLTGVLSGCVPVALGLGAGAVMVASGEKSLGNTLDDAAIKIKINDQFISQNAALVRQVTIAVSEGRVLLTGLVPDDASRIDAVRLSWQVNGVKQVYNEIQIGDTGFREYTRDALITTKLRNAMTSDGDIAGVNYTIDTVNGVIYLIGIARSQSELNLVMAYAGEIANVRRVVQYVRISDSPTQRLSERPPLQNPSVRSSNAARVQPVSRNRNSYQSTSPRAPTYSVSKPASDSSDNTGYRTGSGNTNDDVILPPPSGYQAPVSPAKIERQPLPLSPR